MTCPISALQENKIAADLGHRRGGEEFTARRTVSTVFSICQESERRIHSGDGTDDREYAAQAR